MESLSDSSTLPELSFEDFLDNPLSKKLPESVYSSENDDLEDIDKSEQDDTLHTPDPKRKLKHSITETVQSSQSSTQVVQTKSANSAVTDSSNEQKKTSSLGTPTPPTTPKTIQILPAATVAAASTTTGVAVKTDTNTSIPAAPVLLNSKIALSKTSTTPQTIVKIATTPRQISTTSVATNAASVSSTLTSTASSTSKTTTLSTVTTIDGKTALKTSNGQIVYIQRGQTKTPTTTVAIGAGSILSGNKDKNSATPLRLNSSSGVSTNLTAVKVGTLANSSAGNNNSKVLSTTPAATANIGGNKTVIQLIRSADGKLVPLKTTTAGGKSALTLSPTVAAQLAGKKIITTSGGQVVLKAATATVDASSLKRATSSSTGTTVAEPTVTTAKAIKIQKIITSSSTPITTTTTPVVAQPVTTTATFSIAATVASNSITAASQSLGTTVVATAGGKTLIQGTEVVVPSSQLIKLPKTLAGSTAIVSSANTSTSSNIVSNSAPGSTNSSTGALHAIHIPGKPGLQYVRVFAAQKKPLTISSTAAPTTSTSTVTTSMTANAKLLNAMPPKFTVVRPNPTGKIILTKSPKSDGSPVLSPIATNNLQKSLVTVPTLRKIANSGESPTSSSNLTATSVTLVKNNTVATNIVSGSTGMLRPKAKISEINSEIQRITSSTTEAKKVFNGPDGKRYLVMPRSMLRTAQPISSQNHVVSGQQSQQQQQTRAVQPQSQVYNVVKTGASSSMAAANASEGGMKSFIICKSAQGDSSVKAIQVKRPTTQIQQTQLNKQRQTQQSREDEEPRKLQTTTSSTSQSQNNKFVPIKIKMEPIDGDDLTSLMFTDEALVRGGVRRKHCNCSKSQCLKLYCDCFANGEFCQDCTCKDCFNNLQYEDERQRAIKSCLERNPSAFKPKITTSSDQGDTRLHNKGCNCKRSGCLKNYCECFEAKIPCSSNCKCVGCRNVEDRPDLDMDPIDPKLLESIANSSNATNTIARAVSSSNPGYERAFIKKERKRESDNFDESELTRATSRKRTHLDDDITGTAALLASPQLGDGNGDADDDANQTAERRNANFITQEVIDATIQCMISQADECLKKNLPTHQIEKMVLEELGRCLVEIIDFSIRNTDTSFSQN